MKRERWCFKSLVTSRYALFAFLNYNTGEKVHFEVSILRSDFAQLLEFVDTRLLYAVGIGTSTQDDILLNWMIRSGNEFYQGDHAAWEIYRVNSIIRNAVLVKEAFEPYKKYQWDLMYFQIDLLQYWSRKTRDDKKLSLNSFAISLGGSVILKPAEHADIADQLAFLWECLEVIRRLALHLKEKINLRRWIAGQYGLMCLSWDEARISSELLLKEYCQQTGEKPWTVRGFRYSKPAALPISQILPKVEFKTPVFRDLYRRMQQATGSFEEEVIYQNPGGSRIRLSYGKGGLHTLQQPSYHESRNGVIIRTADVRGMYPALIVANGYQSPALSPVLLQTYNRLRALRDEATDEQTDAFLKLVLATYSGNLDNEFSWLYCPEKALAMRMHGQLLISRYIEELGGVGIDVISVNTDGLEVQLLEGQQEAFNRVTETIQAEFGVVFKVEDYDFIAYLSVSDYVARRKDGSVKAKGRLNYQREPDKSAEFLIIPWAVCQYLVHGVSIETTIRSHTEILDFCGSQQVAPDMHVLFGGKRVANLLRYYVARPGQGGYVYKRKEGKGRMDALAGLKGVPVCLYNEVYDSDARRHPVDYRYYIVQARLLADQLSPRQVSLFG